MLLGVHAKGKGYVTVGKAGFRMTNGNIRCPDMSFTRREHLAGRELPEGFGEFAPDLCIEAILPCEEASEMMQKVREYFGAGAEQVWHLFPERKMVRVYLSPEISVEYHANDELTGGNILPTSRCEVSEIFELE